MNFGEDVPDSIEEVSERCKNDTRQIKFQITANARKKTQDQIDVIVKIAKTEEEVASPNAFNSSSKPIEFALLEDDISRVI